METLGVVLLGAVLLVVVLLIVPRLGGGNTTTCTRCDGTGQINERWPDPSKSGGFHVAKGQCPKCKGKGKVKLA